MPVQPPGIGFQWNNPSNPGSYAGAYPGSPSSPGTPGQIKDNFQFVGSGPNAQWIPYHPIGENPSIPKWQPGMPSGIWNPTADQLQQLRAIDPYWGENVDWAQGGPPKDFSQKQAQANALAKSFKASSQNAPLQSQPGSPGVSAPVNSSLMPGPTGGGGTGNDWWSNYMNRINYGFNFDYPNFSNPSMEGP